MDRIGSFESDSRGRILFSGEIMEFLIKGVGIIIGYLCVKNKIKFFFYIV